MRWRVGFVDQASNVPRFYRRFLQPGYRHCWAARRICRRLWIYCEWTAERLIVGLVTPAFVRRKSQAASAVLVWDGPEMSGKTRPHLPLVGLVHCSTTTAHVVGLPASAGATPWRLACALRRRGALMLMRAPARRAK